MSNELIMGSCGVGGVLIASVPTLLLIVSEVMGVSQGKSNGISHFMYCILLKIIKKEPITSDDVVICLNQSNQTEPDIEPDIESSVDNDI